MEKLTIEQLAPEHLIPYISFGLKVQYEGILNGKELSEYKKKYKKICGNDIFPNYSDAEIIEQIGEMPKETIGLKVGRIRIIEFCKHFTKYRIGGKGMQTHYNTLKFKPILHDLSSLIKEITHNGETFVPMIKLCNEFCDRTPCNPEFGKSKILMHADNGGGLKWWFVYHRNKMTFELSDDNRDMTTHILPQYKMFQKLFEWHFNVFNIPSHLFIDKLNLK